MWGAWQVRETVINHLNGRGGRAPMARNRKGGMSWIDAPDDVYFVATDATRYGNMPLNNIIYWHLMKYPVP